MVLGVLRKGWRVALAIGLAPVAAGGASAEQRAVASRVVVVGEGSVSVAADVARIRSGVSTRGKTVREATETNSKTMAAILTALADSGIPQKDIRTAQLSIQPVYASQDPHDEQKLVGYSVSNHVNAKIRHVEKLGEILGRLIAAGATDVWNVEFAFRHHDGQTSAKTMRASSGSPSPVSNGQMRARSAQRGTSRNARTTGMPVKTWLPTDPV